ncbi:hypothetical protein GCM10010302_28430 [Streptomyces polychromogenes]|uniref:Uncharacterized protein n=1 Tax=Streptomyces polychromogenes TaxID=67342 RepID=A0ABN0VCR0_9ACTN
MNAKKLSRIAPVALVAAGVILSGPVALAAPQHEASSAASVVDHRSSGKKGPYSSRGACESAGRSGHYKSWHCSYESYKWWLYYTS